MSIISLCRLGEWVKVFNDTFCIVHPALTYNLWWPHWYLQPFRSIVFLLYPVGQCYCFEKPEYSEKTIVQSQFTEKNVSYNREGMRCIALHRQSRNRSITLEGIRCIVLQINTRDCTIARRCLIYNYTDGSNCVILVSQIGQYFARTLVK